MSLADALAAALAATNLVLLGDPQQLDQPLQGVHPRGVLSRWKQGFEPPWGHQHSQGFLATLVHFASLSGAKLGPFRGQSPDQVSSSSPQDPAVHKGRGSARGIAAGLSGTLMGCYNSTRSHLFYRFSPEIRTDFGRFEERLSRGAVWARSKSSLDTICGDAPSISTVELSGQLPEDLRPQLVPRLRRRTHVLVDLERYGQARQLPRPLLLHSRLFVPILFAPTLSWSPPRTSNRSGGGPLRAGRTRGLGPVAR